MTDFTRRLAARIHPSDCFVLAILALACGLAVIRMRVVGESIWPYVVIQTGMLGVFAGYTAIWTWNERRPWAPYLRAAVTVAVIFACYTTLGKLGVIAWPEWSDPPYRADAFLDRIDRRMFGGDPSLWMQRVQSPRWVEFYSFVYSAFIPYIYLSLVLGCLGRPPLEREVFLTGWVMTYAISYIGYLFVPAHGPVVYLEHEYAVTLHGGFFYRTALAGVEASGGLQGVFPSLHVGGSVYLCAFDLLTNRLRGLTHLPLVLLIYVSTLMLRYHYVVDLIAGTAVAVCCIPAARRLFWGWVQRRGAAGLPPVPGDEGDVVLDPLGALATGTASVLPAD